MAYLRYEDAAYCILVGAKTRVAPLKMTSIPSLELETCLLGARFVKELSTISTSIPSRNTDILDVMIKNMDLPINEQLQVKIG